VRAALLYGAAGIVTVWFSGLFAWVLIASLFGF
jgi:hypothetical protein